MCDFSYVGIISNKDTANGMFGKMVFPRELQLGGQNRKGIQAKGMCDAQNIGYI